MKLFYSIFLEEFGPKLGHKLGPKLGHKILSIELPPRHARGGETSRQVAAVLTKMYVLYEPAGADEERAYNATITEEMTASDVMQEVIGILATI